MARDSCSAFRGSAFQSPFVAEVSCCALLPLQRAPAPRAALVHDGEEEEKKGIEVVRIVMPESHA